MKKKWQPVRLNHTREVNIDGCVKTLIVKNETSLIPPL